MENIYLQGSQEVLCASHNITSAAETINRAITYFNDGVVNLEALVARLEEVLPCRHAWEEIHCYSVGVQGYGQETVIVHLKCSKCGDQKVINLRGV